MKDLGIDRLLGTQSDEHTTDIMQLMLTLEEYDFKVVNYVSNRKFWEWRKLGLLDLRNIKEGKQQRKGVTGESNMMNLVGYFWLCIVADLKELGVKSSVIRVTKEMLHQRFPSPNFGSEESDKEREKLLDILESGDKEALQKYNDEQLQKEALDAADIFYLYDLFMHIFNLIDKKHDIRLVIDFDGVVDFYDAFEVSADAVAEQIPDPFITISLKQYLLPLLRDENQHQFLSKYNILSKKEEKIFEVLRQEDVTQLHVKLKDGVPYMLTVDKRNKIDIHAKLSEVLVKGVYEEISLKTEFGKVVFSQTSQKTKL